MIECFHRARRGTRGQVFVFALLTLFTLLAFVVLTVNLSEILSQKIRMQAAVDAAALSGAIWQARCLNIIAVLNIGITASMLAITVMILLIALSRGGLIPVLAPKIAKLYKVARKMARIQDIIKDVSPLLVEAETYRIGRSNKALSSLALRPARPPWPQLHIHRMGGDKFDPSSSWIDCDGEDCVTRTYHGHKATRNTIIPRPYMRDDDFDEEQYVFAVAIQEPEPVIMHGRELFGYQSPRLINLPEVKIRSYKLSGDVGVITTAQAAPFNPSERRSLLLIPEWNARLVPVNVLEQIPVKGLGWLGKLVTNGVIHH